MPANSTSVVNAFLLILYSGSGWARVESSLESIISVSSLQARAKAVPCSSLAPCFSKSSTRGELFRRTASARGVFRKPHISSVFLKGVMRGHTVE